MACKFELILNRLKSRIRKKRDHFLCFIIAYIKLNCLFFKRFDLNTAYLNFLKKTKDLNNCKTIYIQKK